MVSSSLHPLGAPLWASRCVPNLKPAPRARAPASQKDRCVSVCCLCSSLRVAVCQELPFICYSPTGSRNMYSKNSCEYFHFFFFLPKFHFQLFHLIFWFVSDFHLLWMLNCKLNRKLSICDPPLSPIQTSGAGGLFMPMHWPKNLPFIHKLKVIWQSAQCLSPGPLHFTLTPSLITVYPWTSHLRLSPLQFSPLKKLVW